MAIQARMEVAEVDITECDREPVHIPGCIQSHGFIIGFSEEGVVTRISENLLERAGVKGNAVLGRAIEAIPHELQEFCRECFALKTVEQSQLLKFGDMRLFARQVSSDKYLLIDLEPEGGDGVAGMGFQELAKDEIQMHRAELFQEAIHRLAKIKDIQSTCEDLVSAVHKLSQYDRVMVYRFDYDKSGVVIAEARAEGLEPYLGLHYPASDIPQPVRELFKLNRCRVICDRESLPIPVLSLPNLRPLDLSHSMLRGVSPVHVEYLRNMGVRASASFSIIINGELWGLVACHQYNEPKYMSPAFRGKCDVLIAMASMAISSIENLAAFRSNEIWQSVVRKIFSTLESGSPADEVFGRFWSDICHLNQSSGMALLQAGEVLNWGKTPGVAFLRRLAFWLDRRMDVGDLFYTNTLPAEWEAAAEHRETTCGILVLRVPVIRGGISARAYMIWFRPELITTVTWAGNPEKLVVSERKGLRLSPRASFENWTQQVNLQSRRWTEQELRATEGFRDEYVKYCIRQQEEVIRENVRLNAIQQGKLELAARVLHDIGNILSGIHTKIACNQAKPPWVEAAKLRQLGDLISQHLDAFERVLGAGKGSMLQKFNELLVQSLSDREKEVREDFDILGHLVGEVENILAVQRDFAQGGSIRTVSELVLTDIVRQAVRLTLEKDEEKKVRCLVQVERGILIRADETKLVRVLMHCIRLAIESIRAASVESGSIELSAVVTPGANLMSRYVVHLRITDNGAGLATELQRELSMAEQEPSSRVSSNTYQILASREAMRSVGGTFNFEKSPDGRMCIQTLMMPCALEMEVLEEFQTGGKGVVVAKGVSKLL